MANENRYYKTPFAESGDKVEVPNASASGAVGYDTGFGPDYALSKASVNRKRIERRDFNGVLNGITKNLKQYQEGLYPTWIEDDGAGVAFSYPAGMVVNHAGQNWISNEAANQEEPGTGIKWSVSSGTSIEKVIPHTVSGTLTAGGLINQIRDSGAFTMPLAAGYDVNIILVVELPELYTASTPTLTAAGSDLFRDSNGTDASITWAGAAKLTLTTNGTNEWSL